MLIIDTPGELVPIQNRKDQRWRQPDFYFVYLYLNSQNVSQDLSNFVLQIKAISPNLFNKLFQALTHLPILLQPTTIWEQEEIA